MQYKNKFQNLIGRAGNVINKCEIYEIINNRFEDDNFPGYKNISCIMEKIKYSS